MIPCYWLAKDGVTCARCRWDEAWVERLIDGRIKRPGSWWPEIHHITCNYIEPGDFGVVCFPAGPHPDDDVSWLNRQIRKLDQVVLFINSDESSRFPVHQIHHPDMHLWVMEPRPGLEYPEGTQFIGCGSYGAGDLADPGVPKDLEWSFAGQINHGRREEMAAALSLERGGVYRPSDGFLNGMPRDAYLNLLARTKVAPCPAGACSQDSFRIHEALELGCVPLADAYRSDGFGDGYWDMTMPGAPWLYVHEWDRGLRSGLAWALDTWPKSAVDSHAYWHLRRRDLAVVLKGQLAQSGTVDHQVTVVIPTSPIPSHPSTEIIEETVASIRARTDAEIIITCDGVREEQKERADDYWEYVRRLMLLAEGRWKNTTPIVMNRHHHQAFMLRAALEMIDTEYLLYVEHDTPLVGDIDLDEMIGLVDECHLNMLRFYPEVEIHPEHKHLMIDLPEGWKEREFPITPTLQWSQRPHLARARWYRRRVLDKHFSTTARTMIEDVMFGVLEHDLIVDEVANGVEAWDKWRVAIYTPDGDIKRSTHLDGRAGDSKFNMRFRYPHNRPPPGAPHPNVGA